MTEDSKNIILQAKNARIIEILAQQFGGSIEKALDIFYKSATAQLIQNGVQIYIAGATITLLKKYIGNMSNHCKILM